MCSVGHHQFYLLVNTFTEIMSFLGQFLSFHFHEAELLHLWSIFIVSSSWCFEFFKKTLFLPAIVLVHGIRDNLYFFPSYSPGVWETNFPCISFNLSVPGCFFYGSELSADTSISVNPLEICSFIHSLIHILIKGLYYVIHIVLDARKNILKIWHTL